MPDRPICLRSQQLLDEAAMLVRGAANARDAGDVLAVIALTSAAMQRVQLVRLFEQMRDAS